MTSVRPVVAVIAGDAGGAAAVGPVIQTLRNDDRVELVVLGYRHASSAWAPRGIAFEPVDERLDERAVEALLRTHRVSGLIAGTSMNGVDLERVFTRVGRRLGLPSMAVLDMWSNYSARFGAKLGSGPDVPDRVAVMDERACAAMLSEGFQPEQLVVTGHPGFDDVLEARSSFTEADRARTRAAVGVLDAECLVLFASQPLAEAWGEDLRRDGHAGYTERSVLTAILASLDRLAPLVGRPVRLVVRPHPREVAPEVPNVSAAYRVLVSREGTPRDVAMSADVVLGMCTILLLESALLGIPTVSIQPGLRTPDALPMMPDLLRVNREEELDTVLRSALARPPSDRLTWVPPAALRGHAAGKVSKLMYELLGMSE